MGSERGGSGKAGAELAAPVAIHMLAFSESFKGIGHFTLCHSGVLGSSRGIVMKPNGAVSQWILVTLFSLKTKPAVTEPSLKITLELTTVACPRHEGAEVGKRTCWRIMCPRVYISVQLLRSSMTLGIFLNLSEPHV